MIVLTNNFCFLNKLIYAAMSLHFIAVVSYHMVYRVMGGATSKIDSGLGPPPPEKSLGCVLLATLLLESCLLLNSSFCYCC